MDGAMEFLKKRRVSTYLIAGAALLAIVGFILLLVSNSVSGYDMPSIGGVIAAGIIAILAIVAAVYLSDRFGSKPWVPAITLLALVLLCYCFSFVILNRVDVIAALSSYDKGNLFAQKALNTSIVSIVFNILAIIALSVSAFLKPGAKEN